VQRKVEPEILDHLDANDERAVRSRKDLRLVNSFMRGEQWIIQQLKQLDVPFDTIIELGAGEGWLSNQIKTTFPNKAVVSLDLISKPSTAHEQIEWIQGDMMEYTGFTEGSVVVANLFIHHLKQPELLRLSELISEVDAILLAEPYRANIPLIMGRCIFPLVNDVTRHDMIVSIRAGFQKNELPRILCPHFIWEESLGLFGGIRMQAVRSKNTASSKGSTP